MPDALTLAQEHMARQVKEATITQGRLGALWGKLVDPRDLDRTYPTFLRSALATLAVGQDNAVKTATAYYGEASALAGFSDVAPLIKPQSLDVERAIKSLTVTGPVSVRKHLANGASHGQAMAAARTKLLAYGKREHLSAGRNAIVSMTEADPNAEGWARVSDGQPCHFCALLVSRGPVYTGESVYFQAHDGCGCSGRPVFIGDTYAGWSPDAIALRRLYMNDPDWHPGLPTTPKAGGGPSYWRSAYADAVADPTSEVFRKFSEKIGGNVAPKLGKAAQDAAVEALQAAKEAARQAQAQAVEEATKAAQEAAEEAAKIAKAEQAKVKKWLGKPAPVKPVAPKPPATLGAKAFDDWHKAVADRYAAFAKATGNYKSDITQSLNYPYVRRVIEQCDMDALQRLRAEKYVDDALWEQAVECMKRSKEFLPGEAEAYKKAARSYKNRMTRYRRYIQEWRDVNGVTTTPLRGMDDAVLRFYYDSDGVEWADKNLPVATGAQKTATRDYSGSNYDPWNDALRKNASRDTVPPGRWGELTAQVDAAMRPLPTDIIVNRGTSWKEFEVPGRTERQWHAPEDPRSIIGTVQTQHGFWSTSNGATAAFKGSSYPVQLKIRVPEGHGAAWVMPYSKFHNERELLLERSSNFFVHDVYQQGNYYVVEVEVLPRNADPADYVGMDPTPSEEKGWYLDVDRSFD